jgi:hypothetical protein
LETDTGLVYLGRPDGGYEVYGPDGRPAQPGTVASVGVSPGTAGVGASAPVGQVQGRTVPAAVIPLNGGGGPNALSGAVYRSPTADPMMEEWVVVPASRVDYPGGESDLASARRSYSALVPEGYQGRVDLTQDGPIVLVVPAGSRPVAVSQSERAYPFAIAYADPAPAPASAVTAPVVPAPAATDPAVPDPAPVSAPSVGASVGVSVGGSGSGVGSGAGSGAGSVGGPQGQGGVGQLLSRAGQVVQGVFNDQPRTVRDLSGGDVEVTFMDNRVGVYDRGGDRIGGSGPDWVHPMQIATAGRAVQELQQLGGAVLDGVGAVLDNVPTLPFGVPGWSPWQQQH